LAGKTTLTEVKTGVCTVSDLMKLNALLDIQDAYEREAMEKARAK
jgi:hypothetical protein